jgi:hypothetical protein
MTDALTTTRLAWHTVAEHVLAPARHAATGRIGLRAAPGGFATPPFTTAEGERQLLVVIDELVVRDADGERSTPLTTLRAAGAFAGVTPGAPADVYTPTTALDLDTRLEIDQKEAGRLADWFALGNDALEAFRAEHADEEPAIVQLWPEHFDFGTTIAFHNEDGINFGASPGDDAHPRPYLYVGPWTVPAGNPFWNESFGASRSWDEIATVDDAVRFFAAGLRAGGG